MNNSPRHDVASWGRVTHRTGFLLANCILDWFVGLAADKVRRPLVTLKKLTYAGDAKDPASRINCNDFLLHQTIQWFLQDDVTRGTYRRLIDGKYSRRARMVQGEASR